MIVCHRAVTQARQTAEFAVSVESKKVVLFPTGDDRSDGIAHLFAKHGKALQNYIARRVQPPEDAGDLTQEVFARLIRSPYAKDGDAPKALLYEIATNLIIDRARRLKSHRADRHSSYNDEEIEGIVADPARVIDTERRLSQVEAVIVGLPPKCRTVFVMSRFEGLSYVEIAARLNISTAMVQKHISKALLRLRQEVSQESS